MGQAGDAVELLALVREGAPDLVVVDIRMPPTNTTEGLQAARQIRLECPDTGILVLSAHVEVEHAIDLLEGGHKSEAICSRAGSGTWPLHRQPQPHRARGHGCRPGTRQGTGSEDAARIRWPC